MLINPQNVTNACHDSLAKDVDDGAPGNTTVVEGLVTVFIFDTEKLKTHEAEVRAWLEEMPTEFHRNGGGGWSFLNLCNTKDGEQWTGMHVTMEALVAMAIGLGLGRYSMPRELWNVLPGGVPYVEFDLEKTG